MGSIVLHKIAVNKNNKLKFNFRVLHLKTNCFMNFKYIF